MIRNTVRIVTLFCAVCLLAGLGFAQAGTDASSSSKQSSSTKKTSTPKSKQVDINSATKDQLTATGLDDATAQKVIDGRPYKAKNELVSKKILSEDEYAKVKDKLVAHGGKTASSKKTAPTSK